MRYDKVFVDTSGWAANYMAKDVHNIATKTLIRQFRRDKTHLYTSNWVLCELVPLLSARSETSRADILAYIDSLHGDETLEIVTVTPEIEKSAYELLHARLDKNYSVCDAASFVVMIRNGLVTALTSDRHFAQEGFDTLLAD